MSRPGFFVVIEGPEGSGKSTLAAPLAARMRQHGVDPVLTREPGGTRVAELARKAVLDPEHQVGPLAELFFYLAARSDLVQTVIRPALNADRVVLSDRFTLSTEAYQMAGRGLPADVVLPANRAAADGLRPDLTLILDLPPAVGRARQEASGKRLDRLDGESAEFHRRVIDYYLGVNGETIRHLDARLSPDRLLQTAWAELVTAAPQRFGGAPG
jgi:dTMP kinase